MKALVRMTNLKKYIWFTVVNFLTTPEEKTVFIYFKTAINNLKKSIILVIYDK
jgi:hypothetical protein